MKTLRVSLACFLFAFSAHAADWLPLGNDDNLDGWTDKAGLQHWSIADGVITGANGPEKRGSELWTEAEFGDFIFETEFRFSGTVDSGIFIKSNRYQVNLGISSSMKKDMTCSIYAPQDGRGKYPGQAEGIPELFKKDDWNTVRIEAMGKHILVTLNGTQVLDYETLALQEKGPIGLQVHGGLDMKIQFRNPRIHVSK